MLRHGTSGGGFGRGVAVSVALAVGLGVGLDVGVAVEGGVGVAGQPLKALLTALSSSSTVTSPSPFASNTRQAASGRLPRAMLTPWSNSSTVTKPSPLQSPTQAPLDAPALPTSTAVTIIMVTIIMPTTPRRTPKYVAGAYSTPWGIPTSFVALRAVELLVRIRLPKFFQRAIHAGQEGFGILFSIEVLVLRPLLGEAGIELAIG